MVAPRIVVIGSDHWPRAALRAELIERGWDAVGFVTIGDAVLALAGAPAPKVTVVDLHGQDAAAPHLGALFRGGARVVAVAGMTEAADAPLREHPWAAILRRPLTLGAIADVVEGLAR